MGTGAETMSEAKFSVRKVGPKLWVSFGEYLKILGFCERQFEKVGFLVWKIGKF